MGSRGGCALLGRGSSGSGLGGRDGGPAGGGAASTLTRHFEYRSGVLGRCACGEAIGMVTRR
jgi:hypothetical protein